MKSIEVYFVGTQVYEVVLENLAHVAKKSRDKLEGKGIGDSEWN